MIYSTQYFAIFITGLLNFFLGWAWYSPALFGKTWTRLMKFDEQKMAEMKAKGMAGMMKPMITSFIFSLITVFVFFSLANSLAITGFSALLTLSVFVWLGFEVPYFLNGTLWEGKAWPLFWIGATNQLAALIIATLVFSFWM